MYDIIIIGGGHAGVAAACAAQRAGIENFLLLEKSTVGTYPASLPIRLGAQARRLTTAKVITVESSDHTRYLLRARAIVLATGAIRLSKNERPIPDHTLTEGAHLLYDPATSGPVVDQYRQSEIAGLFVCGDALHPHDNEKTAAEEGTLAGRAAVEYVFKKRRAPKQLRILPLDGVEYTVPQCISALAPVTLYLRPTLTCAHARILIRNGETPLLTQETDALSPSRLLRIRLTATALKSANGDKLTVQIEPLS